MNGKKKCFVIIPISGTDSCTEHEWTGIFESMIKPAITGSKLGFNCERAKPRTGAFIKDILEGLNRADVVIADLTDRNPNVCYELGIRHTLKNRTILIAQDINDVPSDLQSYWVVTYKKDLTGASEFKKKVRDILREMQKVPDKPDSPVADFLQLKNINILNYEKTASLNKLIALISEISYNINSVNDILGIVKESEKIRKTNKNKLAVSNARFCNVCLELILSTFYIKIPQDLLKDAKSINEFIRAINTKLDLWSNTVFTESVEKTLSDTLPVFQNMLKSFLRKLGELRLEYASDNYQEPKEPVILLARPEHEEYLKLKV